ncbi:MAG: TetR/AcrR family transcriptional regulator [Cyclobacteriaceae bacterium]
MQFIRINYWEVEDKRIFILKTAEEIFAKNGIKPTKVIDIANQAHISKKTIYQIFRSKENLVKEVFSFALQRTHDEIEQAFSTNKAFIEKLVDYLTVVNNSLIAYSDPVLAEYVSQSSIKHHMDEYLQFAVFDRFPQFVKQGVSDKCVNPETNVDALVLVFRNALGNLLGGKSAKDLPEGFKMGDHKALFCHNLVLIFRGILNETALREFNAAVKVHATLNTYY